MREYSEKEIMILNGVLSLAQEGADIPSVRSQQIADAAGVGKSTMYDYFSSKDEIVANALIYDFNRQIEQLRLIVSGDGTFSEKMHTVMSGLSEVNGSNSIITVINSYGGIKKVIPLFRCTDECERAVALMKEVSDLYQRIILQGAREGVISVNFSPDYIQMCVQSALLSVPGSKFTDRAVTPQQAVENAYTMLTKRLRE